VILDRRQLVAGVGAMGLASCTTAKAPPVPGFASPPLARLRMDPDRITHITVCVRPFRSAGPRMDIETISGKRVVHNYGHGGSGWSLSWGAAAIATRNAMEGGARDIAVIGCGAMGITTALTLLRAGARVTVYARDRLPQTRSARATGTWSPSSRIADANKVSPQFPALWESMARHSLTMHQSYVGLPGDPVTWTDRYNLSDGPPGPRPTGEPIDFAHYDSRLNDVVPGFRLLTPAEHPFPVARARHGTSMQFNVAALGDRLMADFLREGGRFETRVFNTPADFAQLAQPVIVNCTGYGARSLMRDTSITPVRGQITWLAPQPEVHYGLQYRSVSILPRPEGIVVQYVGDSEMFGVGIEDETPDRGEAERAIAAIAPLFRQA
jgi:glycine/D-amino acid oxidase-like deaminating enzyme